MATDNAHLIDSGIAAGSEDGITLIVVLVFLSLSLYKYGTGEQIIPVCPPLVSAKH